MRVAVVVIVVALLLAAVCIAQPSADAEVGVFFDAGGTDRAYGYWHPGLVQMYLIASQLDQISSVKLKLEMDPRLIFGAGSAAFPPAMITGDLVSGIQVDYDPVLTDDSNGVILLGEFVVIHLLCCPDLEIAVWPHPDEPDILVDTADGSGWISAIGGTAWFHEVLPVEELRWSEVKALYR